MSDQQQQQQKEARVEASRGQESVERNNMGHTDTPSEEMNKLQRPRIRVTPLMGVSDMEIVAYQYKYASRQRNPESGKRVEGSSQTQARVPQGGHYHNNLKLLQDAYLSMKAGVAQNRGPHENVIFRQKSPMGNTVLHVAAMYGNDEWVEQTAEQAPGLLNAQNDNGDTALHVAARAGHISTLRRLLAAHLRNLPFPYSEKPIEALDTIFLVKNNRGNTFFHEALCNGHQGVMSLVFSDEQQQFEAGFRELVGRIAVMQTNNENKSVMYLAIEVGYKEFVDQELAKLNNPPVELVKLMIQNRDKLTELIPHGHAEEGKSPLLAAILKRDQGILDIILRRMPEWIHLRDTEGRTPLHYAASTGYFDGVQYLLEKCASCASIRDNFGFFPLHLASDGGHVKVVQKLLEPKYCPYPGEILDNGGRNILHLAIESGKFEVVRYILQARNTELEKMINNKDANGNTPLHLASLHCHPRIVHALTWDKRVDLTSVNNMDQTALDAYRQLLVENPSLRQRLTWIALKSAGVQSGGPPPSYIKVPPPLQSAESIGKQEAPNMDPFKDRINTLLLVSTLIITATFAAGFTMPGGTNSSDPGEGMALLLNRMWFKLFIFCITVSMYGAISVTIILIWAQLGDITLALLALKLARPLLGVTLATLSLAFLAGVHLVISDLSWLATTFLVMCVIFILILLLLYILVWFPSSSGILIVRYISYYPFLFLASLVNQEEISGIRNHLDSSHPIPEV